MPDTTIRLLASGGSVADSDLFITRQGADTVDKSITAALIKAYMSSVSSLTVTGLTPGQIVFPGTGGVLSGDAGLTWDNSMKEFTITSSDGQALSVGQNGKTNPAFQVDSSTGSSVTGWNVKSNDVGNGSLLQVTSSGTNEFGIIKAKGTSALFLDSDSGGSVVIRNNGNTRATFNATSANFTLIGPTNTASIIRYSVTNAADTALTASANAIHTHFNLGSSIRTHAAGALALQTDFVVTGTNHAFVTASTITNLAGFALNTGAAGNNATVTNFHGLYVPSTSVVSGTGAVTNSYAMTLNAQTGGTNNSAINLVGAVALNGSQGTSGQVITSGGPNAQATYTTLTGGSISGFTTGSIPFAGVSGTLTEDNSNLFRDATNNRVGFKTNTPDSTIGNAGNLSVGNDGLTTLSYVGQNLFNTGAGVVGTDNLCVGVTSTVTRRALTVVSMCNGASTSALANGINAFVYWGSGATSNGTSAANGGSCRNRYTAGNLSNFSVTEMSALTGAISSASGTNNTVTAHVYNAETPVLGATNTMTNFHGFRARGGAVTGLTNRYGFYVDDMVGGTNRWGFYQAGATDLNTFMGPVGFGTAAPLAPLDVGGLISSPSAGITTPAALISNAVNNSTGVEMRNTSTGNAAEFRFGISDTASNYIAFNMPGTGNTSSLFGMVRSTLSTLFSNGPSNRVLAVGTVNAADVVLGTNNTERLRIASTGSITASSLTNGLVKSTSGTLSNATAGTDYQAPITLTTTGTSGAATFIGNTLNIPAYAPGTGTVTSVSVTTANGVSGSVATATTTPAITLTLGDITPNTVRLTPITPPGYTANKLFADSTTDSLTYYNSDSNVSLQIGQEDWIRVVNNTGSTIANGAAVYLNGASGGLPTIALAQSNAGATTVCCGLATESIANGATGFVTCIGNVNGIDTSAFTAGQTVYLSSTVAGGLTATAPLAPNFRYRVGIVGVSSATVGTIHVTPSTASLGNGSANQVFGMNNAGTAQEVKSIVGTASQVTITNTANTITASLPSTINVNTTGSAGSAPANALTGTLTSAQLAAYLTDETGTGAAVFANSPTLVTPALGTPSALVGTNITGTAAGLTAGTVTTNANLTGAVTSVGNATSLGSFTSAQLSGALTDETGTGSAVFATSPTLVTPALGTPSSATLTNATGLPIIAGTTGTLSVARGGTGAVTLTGLVKGNGTSAFTAAVAGTDYQIPISLTTTGTSGAATFNTGTGVINIPQYASPVLTKEIEITGIAISAAGAITPVAHGLGRVPKVWSVWLVCVTADAGYTAGQVIPVHSGMMYAGAGTGAFGVGFKADTTNISGRFSASGVLYYENATTGGATALVSANWTVTVYAAA